MKKFLATILSVIYLSASIGATVHLHYCMDKLVAWDLGNKENNTTACPYCGMVKVSNDEHCEKDSEGCCKDEQKQVKIENDQKTSEAGFDFSKLIFQATNPVPLILNQAYLLAASLEYPVSHAPPRTNDLPLFVRNCVFRI